MALGRSIKMYLTIFVATTCMYMVLYQYHMSGQALPQPDIIKQHKDKSIDKDNQNGIGGSYTSYSYSSLISKPKNIINSSVSNTITSASASLSSTSTAYELLSSSSSSSSLTKSMLKSATKAKHLNAAKTNSTLTTTPSLTSLSLFSLPKHTTKLFKKMNLFLWSPMSLLTSSSSSSSSSDTKRAIISSKKSSSLDLKKQNVTAPLTSSSSSSSSLSSIINSQNNTALIASSTTTATATSSSSSSLPLSPSSPLSSSSTTTKTTISSLPTFSTAAAASSSTTSRLTAITTTTINSSSLNNNKDSNMNQNSVKLSLQQQQQTEQQLQQQQQQINEIKQPPLYIITPTYRRPEQLAELTRLGYTLKHVQNLLWLVIEDANKTSANVIQILNRIGVPYEYFLAPMPDQYKKAKGAKPRGVSNRNRGLQWLRENATDGVFYFADDDNTYDINIFEQMRYTKKVSMWPVGLVTKFGVSSPIVKAGKLSGFYDGWIGGRKYPVDMAGFAVSVKFLHERPQAKMPFKTGYEEDGFLKSLAPLNNTEIELLANNCTEILTWHTQTKKNNPAEAINATKHAGTNLILLDKMLVRH